jgi:hypothetical protein
MLYLAAAWLKHPSYLRDAQVVLLEDVPPVVEVRLGGKDREEHDLAINCSVQGDGITVLQKV